MGTFLPKSCGCLNKELCKTKATRIHLMSRTPEYKTWQSIHQRCGNPRDKDYRKYGGRGIRVREEWGSFEQFYADMGKRPVGHSIDRIDNNGNYEPLNCQWATPKMQGRNKRHRNQWTGPLP